MQLQFYHILFWKNMETPLLQYPFCWYTSTLWFLIICCLVCYSLFMCNHSMLAFGTKSSSRSMLSMVFPLMIFPPKNIWRPTEKPWEITRLARRQGSISKSCWAENSAMQISLPGKKWAGYQSQQWNRLLKCFYPNKFNQSINQSCKCMVFCLVTYFY